MLFHSTISKYRCQFVKRLGKAYSVGSLRGDEYALKQTRSFSRVKGLLKRTLAEITIGKCDLWSL